MNKVTLVGNLGQVKLVQGQVNTAFARVSVKKTWQGQEFNSSFSVTCFKDLADRMVNLKDGDLVVVEGYLKNSKFNKDGKDQFKLDVICTSVERLTGSASAESPGNAPASVEDIPF